MSLLTARFAATAPGPVPADAGAAAHRAGASEPQSPHTTLSALETALESRRASRGDFRYLLLFRFGLINLVGVALLFAAYVEGWVEMTIAADATHLVLLIAALFIVGLGVCGWRVWQTSRELNVIRSFDPLRPSRVADYLDAVRARSANSRAITAETLRLKLSARIGMVRHIANTLVFLGLIGTVIGFIIALSGVEPSLVSDVKAVGPMVSVLIQGMSVALYTTLVGAVLNIWLMANYRLLLGGTVNLITALVELGERYARD